MGEPVAQDFQLTALLLVVAWIVVMASVLILGLYVARRQSQQDREERK